VQPFFTISLALVFTSLSSLAAPVVIDPQVVTSDQEFLASHARESSTPQPAAKPPRVEAPVPSTEPERRRAPERAVIPPPIAASKESKSSRVTPKAKATPAPARVASSKRELAPETMAEVTVVPEYDDDENWDRGRDRASDRRLDDGFDRARRSEPARFAPEVEVPRKVLHIRRFIHRLLPF
jgi:hypothetical protein